ncbi:MOSC domain-containing protein [Pseudomonas chlororaphis]
MLEANLLSESGKRLFEMFVYGLLGSPEDKSPPRLVSGRVPSPIHFMDKPDNVISLVNLETVRQVSRDIGQYLDPLRFRSNFYIDGVPAWREFDWVGGALAIGDAVFQVDRRNARCAATNVNPRTATRDIGLPSALRRLYGHTDLGVYLIANNSVRVRCGDSVYQIGHSD